LPEYLLESGLELLGDVSVELGLPHDLADESLLVQVLEHGDPLDDVEGVEVVTVLGRPAKERKKMLRFVGVATSPPAELWLVGSNLAGA
jgi:hypothetical protein